MIYSQGTDYTVHANDFGETASAEVLANYTLIDESADTLVDEDGNILVSEEEETQYGFLISAKGTDYTVHAEA